MLRIAPLNEADLDPAQKAIWDRLVASPRGAVGIAHRIWLRNPAIADATEALGVAIAFHALTPVRREVAIMLMGKAMRCNRIWMMHGPKALKAGVPQPWLDTILAGGRPDYGEPGLEAIHDVVTEMNAGWRLSEATYRRAVAALGEDDMVELVGLMGLYWMTGGLIEAFAIPLPEGAAPPFPA
ncbi:MAG: carboxymuconolactone decarboxylase family protein [Alphaproteobacteria bacterium]|nr:carboxymuconolactone decarboxylase family protein [Alphaproteobacteria bacterium]